MVFNSSSANRGGQLPTPIENVRALRDTKPSLKNQGALLILAPNPLAGKGMVERWIPKSLIMDDSEVYDATDHNDGTLVIPEWLAIEKDLI